MNIPGLLKRLFSKREVSTYEIAVKTIRRMGFQHDGDHRYIKDASNGRTMIWFQGNGIKIKVYSGGYAESDFLPEEKINKESLIEFVRENQL